MVGKRRGRTDGRSPVVGMYSALFNQLTAASLLLPHLARLPQCLPGRSFSLPLENVRPFLHLMNSAFALPGRDGERERRELDLALRE